uniref:Uncharacterized protein n=1 Tax=Meloidogyne enterolobii TaxID=390850 RepID=A0A6V7XM36_MELEN|nr:unnamed protein product [Meloidogyne enterolobii]
MSYQGSSSISNGRRYDDVRKIPIPSKYHKSSKKDGKEESRHSTNLNYLHGGSNSTSAQKPNSSSSLGFESRNESLSLQLAAAQSQVIRLETELSNTNTAKSYAESRLLTLQREYNAVVKRNAEIVEVMKTLEIGVETLQQEKVALVSERDELKAKLDASENNSRMLSEQVTFLNERNSTLSKKCVDLLDGSKEFREKATIYEDELKRIKPRYEEMEANFDAINEKNRNYATRINMFEMRERIWIKEKTEMEERQKQNAENWQKIIADIRAKHETEITKIRQQQQQQQQPMVMGISKAEKDNVDRHSVSFLDFCIGKEVCLQFLFFFTKTETIFVHKNSLFLVVVPIHQDSICFHFCLRIYKLNQFITISRILSISISFHPPPPPIFFPQSMEKC